MHRILSLFLTVYLLAGSALLPKGDFGFTSQLSKLYDVFVQINGSASFVEFLEEELLDIYSLPENTNKTGDEPFEKECHPVPFDLITANANSSFFTVTSVIQIVIIPEPEINFSPLTEIYKNADLETVFHPPKPLSHS